MLFSRGRCLLPDLLKRRGWSQTEYARRSGRSQRMISHFCRNERAMQPEDIHTACMLLECDESELHEWIDKKQEADK
ncbi:helix-turn-helix domain-containing protein [Paenibacillus sp. CAU 1782]